MNDNLLHDHSAEMCVLGSVIIYEPKTGPLLVGFPSLRRRRPVSEGTGER